MPDPTIATDVFEPLDVQRDLLLQSGARSCIRIVIRNARVAQLAFDEAALGLAHAREGVVAEQARLSRQLLAPHPPEAEYGRERAD